jgi:polyisoprenyl-phosphate glycosyltransferase
MLTALPEISFVIPLYNESQMFPLLIERLNAVMASFPKRMEVVLVNDGSRDNTAQLMAALALTDGRYQAVFLSRNHGHQLALTAGLASARGTEAVMVLDGDLQDPPELLAEFYAQLQAGHEVVYAVRQKRKEGWLKKTGYYLFYRLLRSISYIDIPLDSGDFCLMSRRIVDILNKMPEESRYIRGMRTWIGFSQVGLAYERAERSAGESKYSFKMLFRLAYNGIFNFSEVPIKAITNLGLTIMALSFFLIVYTLVVKYFFDTVPEGYTTLLIVVSLFSGVQLISLGVIGEYVLRIFFQAKQRPFFIIDKKIIEKEEIKL